MTANKDTGNQYRIMQEVKSKRNSRQNKNPTIKMIRQVVESAEWVIIEE